MSVAVVGASSYYAGPILAALKRVRDRRRMPECDACPDLARMVADWRTAQRN
jgi:hypothetical protein